MWLRGFGSSRNIRPVRGGNRSSGLLAGPFRKRPAFLPSRREDFLVNQGAVWTGSSREVGSVLTKRRSRLFLYTSTLHSLLRPRTGRCDKSARSAQPPCLLLRGID